MAPDNSDTRLNSFEPSHQSAQGEDHFRTIFEQSPSGIALIAPLSGRFHEANALYAEMTGRSRSELLKLDWMAITHPADIKDIQENIQALDSGKAARFSQNVRCQHPDGSYRWFKLSVGLLHPQQKTGSLFIVTAEDVTACKLAESRLREQDRRLSAIIDRNLDAMIQVDEHDLICDWNNRAAKLFGWHKDEVIGQPLNERIITQPDQETYFQGMRRLSAGVDESSLGTRIEVHARNLDGKEFPVEISFVGIRLDDSEELHVFIRDISDRKQAEQTLRDREERYRLLVESSPYCIHEIDLEGRFLSINNAGLQMLGLEDDRQLLSLPYSECASEKDKGRIENLLQKAVHGIASHFEFASLGENPRYFKSCLIPIKNEENIVIKLMGLTEDITSKKESEMLAWRHANFDSLTGLPNRCMFTEHLTQEIKKTSRSPRSLVLLVIDIDRFKDVNDALGHGAGDILLKDAAQRLKGCVRDMDMVARLGGDEFALVLSEVDDPGSIERIAENILQKFSEPFRLQSQLIYASASIGITLYPEDAEDMETLLKNADQAMYAAKEEGRSRYNYFTPFMQKAAQIRMQIANDLRVALNNDEFQLHYQPIVDLKTGLIVKAEALIRWRHPEHGLISPAAFIPIAEENRMIIDIGNWVFHEAALQVKQWRESYSEDFQVSVNKSPIQFHNENHIHAPWLSHLEELGLPGQSITVEITESLLLDISSTVTEQLLNFRDAGIQVSLDDFGTGYSSLSYLKKFDIDYLKIDQSFVRNLEADSDDMVLCEAIIVMAHKLGIKVIAEGIETSEQCRLLAAVGCDYGQGYSFSPPVVSEKFETLLEAQVFSDTCFS